MSWCCFRLVTKDLIPQVWYLSEEQEREWLAHAGGALPGYSPGELRRVFVIELPDCPMAYAYQQAYVTASARRDDLVMPVITPREQWHGRGDVLVEVLRCLIEGSPPLAAVAVIALARS